MIPKLGLWCWVTHLSLQNISTIGTPVPKQQFSVLIYTSVCCIHHKCSRTYNTSFLYQWAFAIENAILLSEFVHESKEVFLLVWWSQSISASVYGLWPRSLLHHPHSNCFPTTSVIALSSSHAGPTFCFLKQNLYIRCTIIYYSPSWLNTGTSIDQEHYRCLIDEKGTTLLLLHICVSALFISTD